MTKQEQYEQWRITAQAYRTQYATPLSEPSEWALMAFLQFEWEWRHATRPSVKEAA